MLACLDIAKRALETVPDILIGLGGSFGTSDITTWALVHLAKAMPALEYFTAVPPGTAQQRISRPLARLESGDRAIHREHLRSGLGAVLDLTALTPFIRRQQWFSRADLPEGTVISTSAVSGMEESLGNLAESAH